MKVLITGATGLIGQEIVRQCHAQNIAVNYLTTNRSKIDHKHNYKGFYWNPKTEEIDLNCFNAVDVIINLAGSPITKRWTTSNKKQILESRLAALKILHDTIKSEKIKIKHIVSASAIGIYPDSIDHICNENHQKRGDKFLSKVVVQWENQAMEFKQLGIEVTIIRIGIILSKKGGALKSFLKPIRNFIGPQFGNGEQWLSWIHIEDLASIFLFVFSKRAYGIYNGVAPNAVKQKELIKTIAKSLRKPIVTIAVPKFLLKLFLGEMSNLVLGSQKVSAKKIEDSGFSFKYKHLNTALQNLL